MLNFRKMLLPNYNLFCVGGVHRGNHLRVFKSFSMIPKMSKKKEPLATEIFSS
jgi:hypothetical protein